MKKIIQGYIISANDSKESQKICFNDSTKERYAFMDQNYSKDDTRLNRGQIIHKNTCKEQKETSKASSKEAK